MNYKLIHPEIGSYPGWPIVLYFHHVHPSLDHYTSLNPLDFEIAINILMEEIGTIYNPNSISNNQFSIPSEPSFLITFDDGYWDNYEYAIPILEKYNIKSVFFIINSFIGRNDYPENNPRLNFMSMKQLNDLKDKGHIIGAHTLTHEKLDSLNIDKVNTEIIQSIEELESKFKLENIPFAYPYGIPPKQTIDYIKNKIVFGTIKAKPLPWTEDNLNIRRTFLPVNDQSNWKNLVKGWKEQWYKSQ